MSLVKIIAQLSKASGGASAPPPSGGVSTLNTAQVIQGVTSLTWNGAGGSIELQRSFDNSVWQTIYTGSANAFTDYASAVDSTVYYRVRENAGAWVTATRDNTIADGNTGTKLYFNGDSNTAGVGASPQELGYAFLSVQATGGDISSQIIGLGGFTITPNPIYSVWDYVNGGGVESRKLRSRTSTDRLVFMAYGLNDCNSAASVTPADYRTAIEGFIDFAVASRNWPANRIVILGPFRGTGNSYATGGGTLDESRRIAFRDAAYQAALNKGACFFSIYDYQIAASLVPPDGLHPDNAQHQLISNYIVERI